MILRLLVVGCLSAHGLAYSATPQSDGQYSIESDIDSVAFYAGKPDYAISEKAIQRLKAKGIDALIEAVSFLNKLSKDKTMPRNVNLAKASNIGFYLAELDREVIHLTDFVLKSSSEFVRIAAVQALCLRPVLDKELLAKVAREDKSSTVRLFAANLLSRSK